MLLLACQCHVTLFADEPLRATACHRPCFQGRKLAEEEISLFELAACIAVYLVRTGFGWCFCSSWALALERQMVQSQW